MDRRSFIRIGTSAAIAAGLPDIKASASGKPQDIVINGHSVPGGLKVQFNGTGAAGGRINGQGRRHSSVLLDSRILIDVTPNNVDMIPQGCVPEAVFFTHSHRDHYSPAMVMKLGIPEVFVGATWYDRAVENFKEEAQGAQIPKITPLTIGQKVTCGDIALTALPANHVTSDLYEQALIYLVEKGGARVLYATDTSGIMVQGARMIGIDGQTKTGNPITGLIMEATMSEEEDLRIFAHSSTPTVLHTARSLMKHGRMTPPDGQIPALLTHIADGLHQGVCTPAPLFMAEDGMEVVFNAPGRNLKVGTTGGNWYDSSFDGFGFGEAAAHAVAAPMFLYCESDGTVYVASETRSGAGIYSFRGGENTGFVEVGKGLSPCHIMHPSGLPYVCAANYTGGAVSVIGLDADGNVSRLEKTFKYGSKSHCHQIKEIPADICTMTGLVGRWLLGTDLGLNCIHVYMAGEKGLRETGTFKCMTGPRHMEFNREKGLLYVLTELSDELVTYVIKAKEGRPVFEEVSHLLAPDIFGGGGADIHLHPCGKFLYTSHRLVNDGITVFAIDGDGMPQKIGYQKTGGHPRNFAITPDGLSLLVACRDDSSIEAYRIGTDGHLTKIGEKIFPDKPVCLEFGF